MKLWKNKSLKALMAGTLSLMLLLTGCGGGGTTGGDTGGGTGGGDAGGTAGGVLEVWAWDVALMQLEEASETWLAQNPDAGVSFKFVEMGTTQIYEKLTASLATGSGIADIICIEGQVLASYANTFPDGFLDVSQHVSDQEFIPAKVAEVTLNDKVHAFPWDAGPVAMFYRTDYFEQAGVNPDDIKTWDDLIVAGEKIMANCTTPQGNPVKMIPMSPTSSSIYTRIRGSLGMSIFDENGVPTVGSAESIRAMEEAKKVYDSGIALDYTGWSEYEQCVANETVAAIPEAIWMIGTIKDKAPQTEGKWGVMQMPMIEGGQYATNNGGANVAIFSGTAYPDQAVSYLNFALKDEETQASGFEKYGLYPSYVSAYDQPVFSGSDPFFAHDDVYSIFIENSKNVKELPPNPNDQEAASTISAASSDIYLNSTDVTKAFTEAQETLEMKFGS